MKRTVIFILVAAIGLCFTACSTFEDLLDAGSDNAAKSISGDPLEDYVFCYEENAPGRYHVATILKPATDATRGEAEVLDHYGNGQKLYAKVFTTHLAEESELAVGEVVLFQSSGFEDPDVSELVTTSWEAYYITDVSDLYKGKITVNGISASTKHLRIPDTEIVVN